MDPRMHDSGSRRPTMLPRAAHGHSSGVPLPHQPATDHAPNEQHRFGRRLGSAASLASSNPFARRKSSATYPTSKQAAARPSDAAACPSIPPVPQGGGTSPGMAASNTTGSPVSSARRDSAVTLPAVRRLDRPPPGRGISTSIVTLGPVHEPPQIPRSRTFSNLPIPERLQKSARRLDASASQSRLPTTWRRGSREPGAASNQAEARLTAAGQRMPESLIEDRASDEAPGRNFDVGNARRTKAGNLCPEEDLSRPGDKFSYSAAVESSRPAKTDSGIGRLQSSTNVLRLCTQFGEVRHTRRPSARSVPSPILYRTPSAKDSRTGSGDVATLHRPMPIEQSLRKGTGVGRNLEKSRSSQLNVSSMRSITGLRPQRPETTGAQAGQITSAQPESYWTGRFSALMDRNCNDELRRVLEMLEPQDSATRSSLSTSSLEAEMEEFFSKRSTTDRMRRAFETLRALCASDEARNSFENWQMRLMVANGISRPDGVIDRPGPGEVASHDKENREPGQQTAAGNHPMSGTKSKLVSRLRERGWVKGANMLDGD